ncbi:TIGR03032 family protein [Uliginosibacterium sediminicola]|uniref:TIGR03032 family protein n=1 Tax=Uliginosibacterium sediminicola TaxID=2024550 RepID=A0ABU9YZF7_9RHOO
MTDVGLKSIKAQEEKTAARPQLLPSPGLGEWLKAQGGSLVFSTYQSARVFFLSADDQGKTVAQERIVGSAMGLAVDHDKLWISNQQQAWRFSNIGPRKINTGTEEAPAITEFDAVFMPRWGIFLGPCDTHDLLSQTQHAGRNYELLFVNTNFNCVASIDGHYNFVPVWKPPFISSIGLGDRCHLNGMGAKDGQLAYVTACARTDEPGAWRDSKNGGGVLIDVQANEIIAEGFAMPHSPRWHDGKVWMLNSGNGDFGYVDPATGKFEPILLCPGFARGLSIIGNDAVIALSRLRPNTFASGLPIKERLESQHIEQRCGLLVVDLSTGKIKHWLTIEGITELYDVAFLPEIKRPYTPGFSEPDKHRVLLNIPNTAEFPLELKLPQATPAAEAGAQ